MANNDYNITREVRHPAIFNHRVHGTNWQFYQNFLMSTPVLETYYDQRNQTVTHYTNEIHRKSWLIMVVLNCDVRDQGFTLSSRTFDNNNMVTVNGSDLRFFNLYGTNGSDPLCPDFVSVSEKIDEACLGSPLHDVNNLLGVMTNPLTSFNRALIKFNYALMPNSMRRDFFEWLWNNRNKPSLSAALKEACEDYSNAVQWRTNVCLVHGSPMQLVFAYRKGAFPHHIATELQRYIRHALIHLAEPPHNYPSEMTLLVVQGHLGGYMSGAKTWIAYYSGLTISDLEVFSPQAF